MPQYKYKTQCFLEVGNQLWKLPIVDYSFSQSIDQQDIVRSELAVDGSGYVNRSLAQENVALNPANWSITVENKPIKSTGSGTGRASLLSGQHHATDEALWGMIAGGIGVRTVDTTTLSSLPNFKQATWALSDIDSGDGGSGSKRVNYFAYSGTSEGIFDFYVLPLRQENYQQYATDYIWTCTAGSGGSAVTIPVIINPGGSANFRKIADIEFGGGPVAAVSSYLVNPAQTGYNKQSIFQVMLALPTSTTLGAYITSNGSITWDIVGKNIAEIQGVRNNELQTGWHMQFNESQVEQLAKGNLYFVTDTPTVSVLAGTSAANNTLITENNLHGTGSGLSWHLRKEDRDQSFFRSGRIFAIALDQLSYNNPDNKIGGWPGGTWTISGLDPDGNYNRQYNIYPNKIIRDGTEYTVNQVGDKATYTIGSVTDNAPTVKFEVNSSGLFKNFGVDNPKAGSVVTSYRGVSNSTSPYASNFHPGDILLVSAGTLDDNGVSLPVDVKIVVSAASTIQSDDDRDVLIFGKHDAEKELFGNGFTSFLTDNEFYAEVEDSSTGTIYSLTENANSKSDLKQLTTATVASVVDNSRTITLSSSNANIRVGASVFGISELAAYVSHISGTTLRVQSPVTVAAGTVLTFLDYPSKAGLSAGEYRWYNSIGSNYLIARMPTALNQSNGGFSDNDVIRVYYSRNTNSGGSAVIKIEDCVVDSASIDFDLQTTSKTTWSGLAKLIHQEAPNFIIQSSAPSSTKAKDIFYDIDNDNVQIRNAANNGWIDCITEGFDGSDNFVANKLSTLNILALNDDKGQPETVEIIKPLDNIDTPGNSPFNQPAGGTKFYSGLAGTNGMTQNVGYIRCNLGDEYNVSLVPATGIKQAHYNMAWVYDYDWALTIDDTEYSGSNFYVGAETFEINGTIPTTLRASTTFGQFGILNPNYNRATQNAPYFSLMINFGTSSLYNTAEKIKNADLKLVGTAKTSTPTKPEYNLAITGGNITITNSITPILTNEIGKVNSMENHVTGQRTIKGSFTAYLDDTTSNVRQLIQDNIPLTADFNEFGSYDMQRGFNSPYSYRFKLGIGGKYYDPNTINLFIPAASFNLPLVDSGDVFTTTFEFTGLDSFLTKQDKSEQYGEGTDFPTYLGNEIQVIYKGK